MQSISDQNFQTEFKTVLEIDLEKIFFCTTKLVLYIFKRNDERSVIFIKYKVVMALI